MMSGPFIPGTNVPIGAVIQQQREAEATERFRRRRKQHLVLVRLGRR